MSEPPKSEAADSPESAAVANQRAAVESAPMNTGLVNEEVLDWSTGLPTASVNAPTDAERDAALGWTEPDEVKAHLTKREDVTWQIRIAALRRLTGSEPRTMEEVGAELGVSKAAISRVFQEVADKVGLGNLFKSAQCRARLSMAARRHWAERRDRLVKNGPVI